MMIILVSKGLLFDNMVSTFWSFTTQTQKYSEKDRETKHQDDELEYHENDWKCKNINIYIIYNIYNI